jgi:UDP-N-acetylmuramyl pentapeptide phosphotransferase/UDP-N-acetylglucosamine-1-phosphate transferase
MRYLGPRIGMMDHPNDRSSHSTPTPRTGGLAILLGFIVGFAFGGHSFPLALGAGMLGVVLISMVDDRLNLSYVVRLLVHFASATVASVLFQGEIASWALLFMAVFFVVAFTNAYNFMDGINGMAGFEALVAGAAYFVLFSRHGGSDYALVCACLAGGAAGFLPWNYPRGTVCMGDVGSAGIGFMLGFLAVALTYFENPVVCVLPLLPVILDTAETLVRRIVNGDPFMQAHRSHFYQRLMRSGVPASTVTLVWTALSVLCAALAIYYRDLSPVQQWTSLGGLLLLHIVVGVYTEARWRAFAAPAGSN